MLKNYLKTAWHNITRNKIYSLIIIFGFACSVAICLMIGLFLMKEYSHDRYHANADHIYRLYNAADNYSPIDYRVKDIITANYPEVENGCLVQIQSRPIETSHDNTAFYIDNMMSADSRFFEMFTVPFVRGNRAEPFQNIDSAVLSESAAKTLFADNDPMGKEIVIQHEHHVIVSGVIQDFPDNSSLQANIIVNAKNDRFKFFFSCDDFSDKSSHRYLFNIYLQLKKNADANRLVNRINQHADLLAPYEKKVALLPLKKMYLEDTTHGADALRGNPNLLYLFAGIAFIILMLAIINYVNLTVARQNKRNRETGIRKIVGASRKDLVFQFLIESMLVTTMAFLIALVLINFGLPLFSKIVGRPLNIAPLFHFPVNIILVFSILLMGIITGVGPALTLSSFQPLRMISGNLISGKKKRFLGNILAVLQFTVSVIIIFCVIVIQKQIGFVKHADPGFHTHRLLRIDVPNIQFPDAGRAYALINKLKQYPGIESMSLSVGVPGAINLKMGSGIEGKNQSLSIIYADPSFLETFRIEQRMGRSFQPGDMGNVCMLNESAFKYFGWEDLANKRYDNGKKGGFEVIGVVGDFHFTSMRNPIQPLCIIFDLEKPSHINVRLAGGGLRKSLESIQNAWIEIIPDYPLKYEFYDEWFNAMYQSEEKLAGAIGLFAFVAIGLSCLGLLGMAISTSESRRKEISIRKVHGATIHRLMVMLNLEYLRWVAVSILIASPVAWYVMIGWLRNYAVRTEISWWVFALSAVSALGIALCTVSWQTWRTATANPIESLKYE